MAADDTPQDGPSLAPPSLGFGFKRKKKQDPPAAAEPAPAPEPTPAVDHAPTIFDADAEADAPPATVAAVIPVPAPPVEPIPEPVPDPEPTPAPIPAPIPVPDPEPVPVPVPTPEPEPAFLTRALAPVVTSEPATVKTPRPPRPTRPPKAQKPPKAPQSAHPEKPARTVPDLSAPEWLTGWIAVLVAGAVVGLVVVGGTAGAQQACSAVRGTGTCGGGPGFVLLVVIIVVATLVGIAVLRLAGVADPVSTSLLAIGVMAVLVVLFLLGSIGSWWMVIAVPLISVASYALSYWVATTFSDVQPD